VPFILKKIPITQNKKIQRFLIDDAGLSLPVSQRILAKARVFDENGNRMQNGQTTKGEFIQIAVFEGQTRGLKPIFNADDFALFDKPTGVIVHPTSRNTEYSLLDEIRYHFGEEANLAHRIDQETSGLVLVTKNKYSDMVLKDMFENKLYDKRYLAVVEGKISKKVSIDGGIKKDPDSIIGVKMKVCDDGKASLTHITPLSYDPVNNRTLVEASPVTGRQHQIRVHLDHIGHRIVGDPIYGTDEKYADMYLLKKLPNELRVPATGAKRLMLQANYLEFTYEKQQYKLYSKLKFNIDNI
jgi:23S rRNA pseudouridine1911/1915/1917 synthase